MDWKILKPYKYDSLGLGELRTLIKIEKPYKYKDVAKRFRNLLNIVASGLKAEQPYKYTCWIYSRAEKTHKYIGLGTQMLRYLIKYNGFGIRTFINLIIIIVLRFVLLLFFLNKNQQPLSFRYTF